MTDEEREALGRAAHTGAPQHCRWDHLYPKVREAYRVQGISAAKVAAEMCAKIAEGYDGPVRITIDAANAIAAAIRTHFDAERHDLHEETRAAADDAKRRMGEASGTGMAIATAIDVYRDRVASLAVAPQVVAGSATERHAIMVAIQAHVDAAVAAERARADKAERERKAAQDARERYESAEAERAVAAERARADKAESDRDVAQAREDRDLQMLQEARERHEAAERERDAAKDALTQLRAVAARAWDGYCDAYTLLEVADRKEHDLEADFVATKTGLIACGLNPATNTFSPTRRIGTRAADAAQRVVQHVAAAAIVIQEALDLERGDVLTALEDRAARAQDAAKGLRSDWSYGYGSGDEVTAQDAVRDAMRETADDMRKRWKAER